MEDEPQAARRYEPVIDGLRAVAVLLVVMFHAGFKGWRGGFAGVDIFFIISGYLISRNIIEEWRGGRFSFAGFYYRRARRILPAMLAVLAVLAATSVAAFCILSPVDLRAFGQSVLGSLAALQNIVFWRQAGYWDSAADHKPLLHFWSLAVEEQFYLVWPALLIATLRWQERALLPVIIIVSLLSLAASQAMLAPDAMAAFYLMPFRGFEFGVGALLLWLKPRPVAGWLDEVALLGGLAAIILTVHVYDSAMPFPGVAALLPCAGAALVIAGRRARLAGWLLRNRLAVGIGLISYSLYLVHWPVLVFFKYWHLHGPTRGQRFALIGVCMALAYANYRLVEQPFRRIKAIGRFQVRPPGFYAMTAIIVMLIALPAAYAWLSPAAVRGMSPDLLAVMRGLQQGHAERTAFLEDCALPQRGACHRPAATVRYAVLGDSFGEDVGMGLLRARPQAQVALFAHGGCKTLVDPQNEGRLSTDCKAFSADVLDPKRDWSAYDAVILGMAWDTGNVPLIPATLDFLRAHGARRVIVAGPRVRMLIDPLQLLMRCKTLGDYAQLSTANMDLVGARQLARQARASAQAGKADYLDLADAECGGTACSNLVPGTLQPLLWDPGHFTLAGATYIMDAALVAFAGK